VRKPWSLASESELELEEELEKLDELDELEEDMFPI
jgi:hypothetical protein